MQTRLKSTIAGTACGLAVVGGVGVLGNAFAADAGASSLPTVQIVDSSGNAITGGTYSVSQITNGTETKYGPYAVDSDPNTPDYTTDVSPDPTDATSCDTSPTTLTFTQTTAPGGATPTDGSITICEVASG